jgi:hypothetical protein
MPDIAEKPIWLTLAVLLALVVILVPAPAFFVF